MTWELDESLGVSAPPNLILIATSSNIDGWLEETFTMPSTGRNGFTRRILQQLVLRATSTPATEQISVTSRVASYAFLTRAGQTVSLHSPARLYRTSPGGNSNSENMPIAWWLDPFSVAVRGGDSLTVIVPGDADATPAQDWALEMLFSPELPKQARR